MIRKQKLFVALALAGVAVVSAGFCATLDLTEKVKLVRIPDQGIQPQVVVDEEGIIHMIYYKGEANQGDIFYVRSSDGGAGFSAAKRVNSQPGSAVALTAIRSAHISVGKGGRVHVVWNGSSKALPKGPLDPEMPREDLSNGSPLLYARLNQARTAFEPQRNLMTRTFALDGGGSVAADARGNVFVAWHARNEGSAEGEDGRRVWIARSRDDGNTFLPEVPASDEATGACVSCGLRIFITSDGTVYVLYRSAYRLVHRDIYLLASQDEGRNFRGTVLDKWTIGACPLSTMSLAGQLGRGVLAAWEKNDQVYYASIDSATLERSQPVPAPGAGPRRKYPVVVSNPRGETILVWTEGPGLQKERSLSWQVFDTYGRPKGGRGYLGGVPVWSFAAAFAAPNGGFTILY